MSGPFLQRLAAVLVIAQVLSNFPALAQPRLGGGGRGRGGDPNRVDPVYSPEMFPARFQGEIYEVPLTSATPLDPSALAARAATSQSLADSLASAGPARILYRFDQPVDVFTDTIQARN